MRILYDCFSCSPYYGSDEEIGWMWPYIMKESHEVWALVRKDRREDIERFCAEHTINGIHFVYCDIPDWMNFYYKNKSKGKNRTLDFLAYQYLWQFSAYKTGKKLNKQIHFDIVHHVSTNDFRLIGFLYKLKTPYIIGPIGGAQEVSQGLSYYIRNHYKSEMFRRLLNRLMIHLPGYRQALNVAKKVYFSNPETRDFLLPQIKDKEKCELLTEIGFAPGKHSLYRSDKRKKTDKTVFMWAGRMEYRKGLELLIDVLKNLPMDKEWKLVLCGDGSEKQYIYQLCCKEAFRDRVIFTGKLPYEQVQKLYQQATAFVFPSLRETTGTVIIEAMAHEVPVICLKQGGGALLVNSETGFLIPVESREVCLSEFTKAMIMCIDFPELVKKMGERARQSILETYLWEKKCKDMERVYSEISLQN